MDIYTQFLSNDDSAPQELEYRYTCSKPEYDTVLRFLRNMDGLKQASPSVSLNIIFGKDIRMNLSGSALIEYYCSRNSIPPSEWSNVSIGIKKRLNMLNRSNKSNITLSEETEHVFADLIKNPDLLESTPDEIKAVVKESSMTNRIELAMYRKLFRLRSRTSFLWKDLLRIDITRVKENSVKYNLNDHRINNLYLNMKEANLNKQPLKYEIEVEVIKSSTEAVDKMKELIDELEGLLGTDDSRSQLNPIIMKAYNGAINSLIVSHYEYLASNDDIEVVDGPETKEDAVRRYNNSKKIAYIIPKLVSMTKNNLPIPTDMAITDKADGDSCIVMVFKNEMITFDSGFRLLGQPRVITGSELSGGVSLFAGEYIQNDTADIAHKTVYLYDCYMFNGVDMRRLKLVSVSDEPTRIKKVDEFVALTTTGEPSIGEGLRMRSKKMLLGDSYEISKEIWSNKHTYPYTLDGIIFTPASTPVAQSAENPWEWGYKMDRTWHLNFKWKPPEFNTIDFILEWSSGVVRGKDGLVRKGILRTTETVQKNGIKATVFPLFQATEYVKPKTYTIEVVVDSTREARTEETNEFIQNHSVVECRYDSKSDEWIVLRNRNDKTKVWENTRQTIETYLSKYRIITSMASNSASIDTWSRSILQKIFAVGRKAREIKQAKQNVLITNLKNFLVFHNVIPSSSTPSGLFRHLKDKKEQIMNLLNEPYVAVPLPFGLSGSNSTYVANTIWKSIHEPVYIDSFRESGPSSGAGSDEPVIADVSKQVLLDIPISDEVNTALVDRVRSWVGDVDVKGVIEISDRYVPIVKEGMLWTNKEGIRQQPLIIRGDARRPTTGWINSDDKKIWNMWKKETGGASLVLSMGVWGAVGTMSHRKGVISSITNSARSAGSKVVVIYWDPAKIEMISKSDPDAKKKRGGHLIYKDLEFISYPKDKMIKEFQEKGWTADTDDTWTIHDIVADDPLAKFLSVMVFKN